MSFSDRLAQVRMRFGGRGVRTSVRSFAVACEIGYRRWQSWETEGREPHDGQEVLALAFDKVASIRQAGVDPKALAEWVVTGQGDMPGGAGAGSAAGPAPQDSAWEAIVSAANIARSASRSPNARPEDVATYDAISASLRYALASMAPGFLAGPRAA